MHVCLHDCRVDAQLFALGSFLVPGKAHQDFIDRLPRLGRDAIDQFVEGRIVDQRIVVNAHEETQHPTVADAGHQVAERQAFNLLHHDQPQHGLRRDALDIALELPLAGFQILVYGFQDGRILVQELRHRLVELEVLLHLLFLLWKRELDGQLAFSFLAHFSYSPGFRLPPPPTPIE